MPRKIVMWGAPLSGKSTYLLSLVFWQEHREGKESERRLCMLPADRTTADWVTRMATNYAIGEKVKTGSVQELKFRMYDLPPEKKPGFGRRDPARSRHVADLTFWDAPGEYFRGPIPPELMSHVVSADGLLLIINPTVDREDPVEGYGYWNFFDEALMSVKHGMATAQRAGHAVPAFDVATQEIRLPVAICLSHLDRAENPDTDAQALLSNLLGDEEHLLREWIPNNRAFTFSATGPVAQHDGVGSNDPNPRHIMYPIEWLLNWQAAGAQ